MHENVAKKIFILVEVQGGTSGTHAAVGKLNSALATCSLNFSSKKSFKYSGSEVKVRSEGKVKGIVRPELLSAAQRQVRGGHEISYTCLISFSHLGVCD